jgi:hypothetical protein
LVSVGNAVDVMAAFEETNSELLQLSGLCDDLELYPETETGGKAVIRRGQLLDAFLSREGKQPLFLHLTDEEQLLVGNDFMRRMAKVMNPSNPRAGRKEVVDMIDGGRHLADRLGLDLDEFLPRIEKNATSMVININEFMGKANVLHDRNPS